MRYLLSLLLALACTACGSSAKFNRAKAPDDIREAVFRHQFAQFQRASQRVCFLKVAGQDPSDEFMQRFTDLKPSVRKASESKQGRFTVDSSTGEHGVVCDVDAVKLVGDTTAEASASYRIGSQGAARYRFLLKWDKGNWKVTGRKFLGVS